MQCSVAQCLEVVGEWWTMLIVRDTFVGVTRFDELQARLGISRNILRQRLDHLVRADVLEKVPYCEHPPRYDYRLTAKGRDLWPVVAAMREWGDRHAAAAGPTEQVVHTRCGAIAHALLVCSSCGEPLDARDVRSASARGATGSLAGRRG